ncbi:recombinase family protein [uncultured Phocaeicola sp.]|uniref:recombinase family protein n=2 Tax=Bacteria TaxID=2 RepID=UPI0025ADE7F9|nr:recombinase family protein [uncultured Phocaeicola sp.]
MARKSKKIDFVNVNDLGQQTMTVSAPVKSACYKVGLYARLSEETEANRERATIETQMELLRKFVAENDDMVVFKEYADISYSGTNFERPGFEEMIKDMRSGLLNCIVVKDLSRLGRNYVETGNYIERVFPFFDVRFIAVTDGYDSNKSGEELLMPLKNMVNEMYVKDLSKKMKSAHRAYWKNGEYSSGKVPYGYVNIDRHLYPDDKVKENVLEIYRLFLEGNSLKEITRQLNSKKILNPKSYKLIQFGHDIPEGMNTEWNSVTVRAILTNHAYVGESVHNKMSRVNGKTVRVPKENWIIVEDTHAPLVSREDFDTIQEMLEENVKHFHSTHGKNGFDHARFNLIGKKIVCADCGKIMAFRTEGTRHVNKSYRCKTYLNTVKKGCTNHLVSAEAVNAAVFSEIQEHMHVCIDKEETVKRLNAKTENLKKYDLYGKEADKIRKELQKTTEVKAGIFEDYRDKLIDEEQYVQISEKYAAKIKELSARLDEMLKAQAEYSREYHINEDWKAVVQKYLTKRKLTKEMVDAFVDRVEVHEDANIVVHLIYDDVLESLKSLSAEREGGSNG